MSRNVSSLSTNWALESFSYPPGEVIVCHDVTKASVRAFLLASHSLFLKSIIRAFITWHFLGKIFICSQRKYTFT